MRTNYHNWIMDRLCELFGDLPVEALVCAHGGQTFYVPGKPTPRVIALVGYRAAQWLCAERGGQTIEIMSQRTLEMRRETAARRIAIQASDKTANELAKEFGISARQVRNIRNGWRDPRLN